LRGRQQYSLQLHRIQGMALRKDTWVIITQCKKKEKKEVK